MGRRGDGQRQRDATARNHRMILQAIKRLRTNLDGRAACRAIIDGVGRSRRRAELAGGKAIDRPSRFVTEQALQRVIERAGADRIESALAVKQRRQPFVQSLEQLRVAEVRDVLVMPCRERRALPKSQPSFAPLQQRQAMTPNRIEQARLDRCLVRPWIGR